MPGSSSSPGSRRHSGRSPRWDTRPISRPRTTVRSVNVIDNLDEILTQRSQVSMSQYNESGDESGHSSFIRRRHSSRLDRSVTPPSNRTNRQSIEQRALVGKPTRTIQRRNSSNSVRNRTYSSSSSESSYYGVLTNRRPAGRVSVAPPIQASSLMDDDHEDEELPGGGFLSCMRCFKTSSNSSAVERSVVVSSPPKIPLIFQNRYCHFVHKYLTMMSENLEADVLANSSSTDSRLVFILYSLLTGDALLTLEEYTECDEWCDWLSLGFSDSTIDAFDRDINRTGSQTMGLLFQIFFALEYSKIAQLCVTIIQNMHFIPSPLFGLFSVNCAKWTRDVIIATIHRYDQKGSSSAVPPLIDSAKIVFDSYKNFSNLFDWWISNGHSGSIDRIESNLLGDTHLSRPVTRASGMYESFADDDEEEEDEHVPLAYRSMPSGTSPNRRVSFQPSSRVPGIDLVRRSSDTELIKSVFVVGGLYYTYCILFFTKFWLEQKLIQVDADTARERLNNQYLETSFVSKLELSSSMSVLDVEKRIDKLIQRIEHLWEINRPPRDKDTLLAN